MTSLRKIKDATKQTRRPRPRRSPTSVHAEKALALLDLEPPEGLLIDVPEGTDPDRFRKLMRSVVDRMVRPYSAFRFRVSFAANGQILVGCFE
jgi:hypothetical protein